MQQLRRHQITHAAFARRSGAMGTVFRRHVAACALSMPAHEQLLSALAVLLEQGQGC